MSNVWYGGSTGLVLNAAPAEPMKTPPGLLVTRAVETKDGWIGQIIVDKVIVWESDPIDENDVPDEYARKAEQKATKAANERVIAALGALFA